VLITVDGKLKVIDFGAAVDMCTGINFNPESGMLDPRRVGPQPLRFITPAMSNIRMCRRVSGPSARTTESPDSASEGSVCYSKHPRRRLASIVIAAASRARQRCALLTPVIITLKLTLISTQAQPQPHPCNLNLNPSPNPDPNQDPEPILNPDVTLSLNLLLTLTLTLNLP